MMMEYAGQGEVFKHLAKAGKFSEKRSSRVSYYKTFLTSSISARSLLVWPICTSTMSFIETSSQRICCWVRRERSRLVISDGASIRPRRGEFG